MKKTIITDNQGSEINKGNISKEEQGFVLTQNPAVIDLPREIAEAAINNNKTTFRAASWCMFPVIWAGDILVVQPIRAEGVLIGDIVLYKSAGRAYAHRLIKKYEKQGKLYIVTAGEKEYKNRKSEFNDFNGVPADNILGKVIKIKRGKLCFAPDGIKLNLINLVQGAVKLGIWNFIRKIRQYIAEIFTVLQNCRWYRHFLKRILKGRVLIFVGTPLVKKNIGVDNFCHYRNFKDFHGNVPDNFNGRCNLSARINNRPVGNVSLFLETTDNRRICMLSNFIVRIPYRGAGVGGELLKDALFLCGENGIDEIRIFLSQEDERGFRFFKKFGFKA